MDALDGLINAQIAALKVMSEDGVRRYTESVANDVLEYAANQVSAIPDAVVDAGRRQAVCDVIRALKRG